MSFKICYENVVNVVFLFILYKIKYDFITIEKETTQGLGKTHI